MPGDVITTGTPPGVGMGMKPEPQYLKAGDVVTLGIEKLGEQRQTFVAWGGEPMSFADRFAGRRAVVTGGASGIGLGRCYAGSSPRALRCRLWDRDQAALDARRR